MDLQQFHLMIGMFIDQGREVITAITVHNKLSTTWGLIKHNI